MVSESPNLDLNPNCARRPAGQKLYLRLAQLPSLERIKMYYAKMGCQEKAAYHFIQLSRSSTGDLSEFSCHLSSTYTQTSWLLMTHGSILSFDIESTKPQISKRHKTVQISR